MNRGIDLATASKWRLGYIVDPLPGHEKYSGRLAIPYLTPGGPVTMVFRCLHESGSDLCKPLGCIKYLAPEAEYRGMFGVWNLSKEVDRLYIVEGELDAIVATSCGFPSIAIPGASRWEPHWSYMFDGYGEITALCDGDKDREVIQKNGQVKVVNAGKLFAKKIKEQLRYTNVTVRFFPEGHDTASLVKEQGSSALALLTA